MRASVKWPPFVAFLLGLIRFGLLWPIDQICPSVKMSVEPRPQQLGAAR